MSNEFFLFVSFRLTSFVAFLFSGSRNGFRSRSTTWSGPSNVCWESERNRSLQPQLNQNENDNEKKNVKCLLFLHICPLSFGFSSMFCLVSLSALCINFFLANTNVVKLFQYVFIVISLFSFFPKAQLRQINTQSFFKKDLHNFARALKRLVFFFKSQNPSELCPRCFSFRWS